MPSPFSKFQAFSGNPFGAGSAFGGRANHKALYIAPNTNGANAYVNGIPRTITSYNAGGKYYVNASGNLALAPVGDAYVHHVHDGTSYAPRGVLWEPAVQNLFTQSETLGAGGLSATRATVSANADTAPDGAATADRLIEDATAGNNHIAVTTAYTLTAASYVFGTFAKAGTRTKIEIANYTVTKARGFDLSAGTTFATSLATFTAPNDYGMVKLANGWYYCWIAFTGTAAGHTLAVALNNGTAAVYDGDGASYATLWGHQLHLGSGPGSYIKSAGSAATRTADTASISSAFLTPIKGAGRITIRYTPNAASSGVSRVLFDCRDGSGNGFVLSILSTGVLSIVWNGTQRDGGALTWAAGTTYDVTAEWNGSTITTKRDGVTQYGPTAQAAGLSTIGATAYLGASRLGTLQADGAISLIEAVAA